MDPKPGVKSTENWMVPILAAVQAGMTQIEGLDWQVQCSAMLGVAALGVAYIMSRGKVKASANGNGG